MITEELPEELLKLHEEFTLYRFQHILVAPTSSATRAADETLTCLNQGQSYELRLQKLQGIDDGFGQHTFKSVLRVIFHDKRLQYEEEEQVAEWQRNRPDVRLFDIDLPLSLGLYDARYDGSNSVSFMWDSRQVVRVYVKVNCISTEFTTHKRGGEKGVPFRIQIETYLAPQFGINNIDTAELLLLHCASCKINVFKPKGAERKNKTDLDKFYKLSEEEKSFYRPFSHVTEFSEVTIAQAYSYLEQRRKHLSESDKGLSTQRPPCSASLADSQVASLTPESCVSFSSSDESAEGVFCGASKQSNERYAIETRTKHRHVAVKRSFSSRKRAQKHHVSIDLPKHDQLLTLCSCCSQQGHRDINGVEITSGFCPERVALWLLTNRFHKVAQCFVNYSGSDMLQLSREQCILICGPADGIRLNNAIRSRSVRPLRTIYVCLESRKCGSGFRTRGSVEEDDSLSSRSSWESSPSERKHQSLVDDDFVSSPAVFCSDGSNFTVNPLTFSLPESSLSISSAGRSGFAEAKSRIGVPETLRTSHHPVSGDDRSSGTHSVFNGVSDASVSEMTIVYQAVYLECLTYSQLVNKLAQVCGLEKNHISRVHLRTCRGLRIAVSDSVVKNMTDNSRFLMELKQDSSGFLQFSVLLKSLNEC